MGTGLEHRNVTMLDWRRRLLFVVLLAMGMGYIVLYLFFVRHSENFIVAQNNRRAIEFGKAHPVILPASWKFGPGSPDNVRLGYGWNTSWAGGAWMVANDAWIMFAPSQRDSDLILTFNTVVFTTPVAPRNRVDISINGQTLGSWDRGGPDARSPIEVRVPAALLREGEGRVRIHIDRLASMYRPDVGITRNGQHLMLATMTVRKPDAGD
jgi:hypothetical protein